MRRCLTPVIIAAFALVACNDDAVHPMSPTAATRASQVASAAPLQCGHCAVGPVTVVRSTGKPQESVFDFEGDPSAPYVIDINDNGSQGGTGGVSFNGASLLGQSDFKGNGGVHLHQPVTVLPHNRLTVRLEGKPGSQLSIEIRGGVEVIGAAGGELRSPGGAVQVTIPPGALDGDIELSIDKLAGPPDTKFFAPYELGPTGTQFHLPVTLTFHVTPAQLKAVGATAYPVIVTQPDPQNITWTLVDDSRFDPATGDLTAPLQHFSNYTFYLLDWPDIGCADVLFGTMSLTCGVHTALSVTPLGLQTGLIASVSHIELSYAILGTMAACDNTFAGPPPWACLPYLHAYSDDATIAVRNTAGRITGFRNGATNLQLWYEAVPKGQSAVTVSGFPPQPPPPPPPPTPPGDPWVGNGVATDITVNSFKLALGRGRFSAGGIQNAGAFKSYSVLYGGGLTVGTSASSVLVGYDARGVLQPGFLQTTTLSLIPNGQKVADHQTAADLCPNVAQGAQGFAMPANVSAVQETFAWSSTPFDNFIVIRYTFFNTGAVPVTNFYAGLTMDWDIGNAAQNLSRYDAANQIATAYYATSSFQLPANASPLIGVATINQATSYHSWKNQGGFDPATPAAFFGGISGGIQGEILAPADVRNTIGVGPLTVSAGGSATATFAVLGGDNFTGAVNAAVTARQKAATLPAYSGGAPSCQ